MQVEALCSPEEREQALRRPADEEERVRVVLLVERDGQASPLQLPPGAPSKAPSAEASTQTEAPGRAGGGGGNDTSGGTCDHQAAAADGGGQAAGLGQREGPAGDEEDGVEIGDGESTAGDSNAPSEQGGGGVGSRPGSRQGGGKKRSGKGGGRKGQ